MKKSCPLLVLLFTILAQGMFPITEARGAGAGQQPHESPKATIRQTQKRLKELGHDPGVINGRLGVRTKTALRLFQRDNGLPVTGRLDVEFQIDLTDSCHDVLTVRRGVLTVLMWSGNWEVGQRGLR